MSVLPKEVSGASAEESGESESGEEEEVNVVPTIVEGQ